MKMLVTHNAQGDISSVSVPNAAINGNLSLSPESGEFITEIDADTSQDGIADFVEEMIKNSRIQQGHLVPKS